MRTRLRTIIGLPAALAIIVSTVATPAHAAFMPGADTDACDLRVELNSLLRDRADLSASALWHVYENENSDMSDAAERRLNANAVALGDIFRNHFDSRAESDFVSWLRDESDLWREYAVAHADDDDARRSRVLNDLEDSSAAGRDFYVDIFADASFQTGDWNDLYVNWLDARVAGNATTSTQFQNQIHMESREFADYLSDRIAMRDADDSDDQARYDSRTDTAACDLRVELNSLLRDRAALSVDLLRQAHDDNAAMTTAARTRLNENTTDLGEVLRTYYGTNVESRFLALSTSGADVWTRYAMAVGDNDSGARQAALADLDDAAEENRRFYSQTVSGANIDFDAWNNLYVAALNAYADDNENLGFELSGDAALESDELAAMLATGIIAQFDTRFDEEGTSSSSSTSSRSSSSSSRANREFPDVDSRHDPESIEYLVERGIVEGNPDGTFRPVSPINRAEFTKIVVLSMMSESDMDGGTNCFPDVRDQWYARYVCTAKEHGIVKGYPDGTFKPDMTIQSEEAFKVVAETLYPNREFERSDPWYQTYVKAAQELGFNIDVRIGLPIVRWEMASMLARALTEKNATEND